MTRIRHDGDCTIYSSLMNKNPEDGICTCDFGWQVVRENGGDRSELYSKELQEKSEREHPVSLEEINRRMDRISGTFGESREE